MKIALNKIILVLCGLLVITLAAKILGENLIKNDSIHKSRTEFHIRDLATAMKFYKYDYGEYPEGTSGEILLQIMGENPLNREYLEGNPFSFDNEGDVLDEWGNPITIEIKSQDKFEKMREDLTNYRAENGLNPDDSVYTAYAYQYGLDNDVFEDVQKVADHIDHVVNLVGIDYVAFG